MSECCSEYNCRRKQPMQLMKADFSGRWFVVTRLVPSGGQQVAVERHELPLQTQVQLDQMRDDSSWLQAVLGVMGMTKDQLADHLGVTVEPARPS